MGCQNPNNSARIVTRIYDVGSRMEIDAIERGDLISCTQAAAMIRSNGEVAVSPLHLEWAMMAGAILLLSIVLLFSQMLYKGRDWE